MNCRITYTPDFAKALKKRSKRYRSMKQDYAQLLEELHANPFIGTDLGHHLRKVRLAITSKGKGKSAGARVITYTVIIAQTETEVKLITIYDKSERENINDAELLDILRRNNIE
ncbi:MAG TPA: type II toxin-antitoxin system RelE/ParE family toxin [Candidatus Bacteroides merdigallinarum]|uniref:Type II toxin-antitoxin system RelE/ParE family toxin n=1 Tax=Candidatus Bacteroides merdigallinarum TaxID=2838473 RepID=A0A9D2E8S0_9BACE|nr:type II toxin-antitoxin system RelE/ParE family toxin [Candidatus Bacteroides merdigallinarum]